MTFTLATVACESIFIPDPIDPRMPKYTETGNNVAGAHINDKVWKSEQSWNPPYGSTDAPSFDSWPENDSVVIRFSGETGDKRAYIEFHLKNWSVDNFESISQLGGLKIELDGNENSAYYYEESYNSETCKYKGVGQFYPKNIQLNDSLTTALFSGTFGFTVTDSLGNSTKVSYGRFDYSLNKEYDFFINQEW